MKLDQFSYHEIMDRISVIQDTFEQAVVEHPVSLGHAEFRTKCVEVQNMLSQLYQDSSSLNPFNPSV